MNNAWDRYVDIPCIREINCPVILDGVVCDGYIPDKNIAVITHFHNDHIVDMDDILYEYDVILMHPITYAALNALNKTTKLKQQISAIKYNVPFQAGDATVRLLDANHIPGSCHVLVEYDGMRLLYSGDFNYLGTSPPKCDYLVLDATHGDPTYSYNTNKDKIMCQMHDAILEKITSDQSVVIRSSRGTLQEIIMYLESNVQSIPNDVQFIASKTEIDILQAIYASKFHHMREIIEHGSIKAHHAIWNSKPCIIFTSDLNQDEDTNSWFTVYVDRYRWFKCDTPGIFEIDGGIRCNLSSHASYSDIMRFIRDVSPRFVLTDSSRSRHAEILAETIRNELHIEATASKSKLNG